MNYFAWKRNFATVITTVKLSSNLYINDDH